MTTRICSLEFIERQNNLPSLYREAVVHAEACIPGREALNFQQGLGEGRSYFPERCHFKEKALRSLRKYFVVLVLQLKGQKKDIEFQTF